MSLVDLELDIAHVHCRGVQPELRQLSGGGLGRARLLCGGEAVSYYCVPEIITPSIFE